jgi:hypothetical protein
MARAKLKIPRSLKPRLRDVASKHEFDSIDALAFHFVDRGLRTYGAEEGDLGARIERVTDEQGYSSSTELVEHLLIRGLRAYEKAEDDPARLEERLRGLGYIE